MTFLSRIKAFRASPKRYIVTVVLAVLVIILGCYSYMNGNTRGKINYNEHLQDVAVTVNGKDLTLKDLGFYIAYEEHEVERQAEVYNPEKTNKYWNLHIDGEFVRVAARNAALHMAIHDEIFYQMAESEQVSLSEQDIEYARNTLADFLSDLEDYGQRDRLSLSEQDYEAAIMKLALAEKYQEIYALTMAESKEQYDFAGDKYKELLTSNQYIINKGVWNRVDIGNVSIQH